MGYNESRWSSARTLETMIDFQQTVRGLRLTKLRRDRRKLAMRPRLDQETSFSPRCALGIALWFGLIIGLAELVLTRVQKPLTDPSPGLFRMNRHIMWTIPTVNLVVFGFCGLVAALVLRARPRLGVRVAVSPLVFLATLTLLLSCRWLHVLACLVLAFLFAFRLTRRIESSLPAFRRLVRRHAARAGGAGGRRDRVVARRADSWRTPGGRSPARGISGWSGRSRSECPSGRTRYGAS